MVYVHLRVFASAFVGAKPLQTVRLRPCGFDVTVWPRQSEGDSGLAGRPGSKEISIGEPRRIRALPGLSGSGPRPERNRYQEPAGQRNGVPSWGPAQARPLKERAGGSFPSWGRTGPKGEAC